MQGFLEDFNLCFFREIVVMRGEIKVRAAHFFFGGGGVPVLEGGISP